MRLQICIRAAILPYRVSGVHFISLPTAYVITKTVHTRPIIGEQNTIKPTYSKHTPQGIKIGNIPIPRQ